MTPAALPSSFRDPSGFLFEAEGHLYRQVNPRFREEYEALIESGLYEELVSEGLLIPHEELPDASLSPGAWKLLRPERVAFVSYPYEWCFGELKAAALATLEIQRRALRRGMILRDASAYNIQFRRGKPVLIDTLSFRRHRPGEPWEAYRQFCQHFLAPLAVASRTDFRLGQWFRIDIDGMPLDLASALLPGRSWLSLPLLLHVHLHARSQRRYAAAGAERPRARSGMGRYGLEGLLGNLEAAVRSLEWKDSSSAWSGYYESTNYAAAGLERKKEAVREFVERIRPALLWDLGANVGVFSGIAAESAGEVVAFDSDPVSVERHYGEVVARGDGNVLPLVLDLTNPSGGIGWANRERLSLEERGPADLALALALVHHLAIGNNVPLESVARFFASLCRNLVVEFVPKEDSQVRRMLASREDVFDGYSREGFEAAFASRFETLDRIAVPESERTLYRMRRRDSAGSGAWLSSGAGPPASPGPSA